MPDQANNVADPRPQAAQQPQSRQLAKLLDALSKRMLQAEAASASPGTAVEGAASALFVCGPEGQLLFANDAYARIESGLSPAGRAVLGALHVAPACREVEFKISGTLRYFGYERDVLRGARGAPDAIIGRLIPRDEVIGLRDDLALSEERFGDIARLVSDWVWETDRELRLVYVSSRITEALGYHPRELLGHRLEEIATLPLDLFETLDKRIKPIPFRGRQVGLRHRDGAERRFRLNGLPVFDRDSGEFLGFRGTARDVTEFLAHEEALQKAVEAAEAANRSKSQFLANTSHELRTPLNAIIGFSEIMDLEQFGPVGNERYRTYVSDILESAHHLLTLINDILDVAKIESGKLELEETTADAVKLCQQTLRLVADRASRHGITLESHLPEDLPALRIDERKVKQILLNLLSNAIKFTPRDGRVQLSTGLDPDGGFCFVVSDTGIGIAPEDQPTALTAFGQVESQLSRRFEGTGLGLPLSHALAQLHGGGLELDSTLGAGTTVKVRLPESRILAD